jgi:hypothetical protein
VVTQERLARCLLNLASGGQMDLGVLPAVMVQVRRVDEWNWSVAGGPPCSLLVAVDACVRAAGLSWAREGGGPPAPPGPS